MSTKRSAGLARAVFVSLSLSLGLAACSNAPPPNSTYTPYGFGRAAPVTYGTIVSMRNVAVQGQGSDVGAFGGAALGGVGGSFLGGSSFRGSLLGAIGGALLGGLGGAAVDSVMNSPAHAVEFIIKQDDGQTISVVQSNESRLLPGERVAIIHGDHTRLTPISS